MRTALISLAIVSVVSVFLTATPVSAVDEGDYILIYHPGYLEELTPLINWRNSHGHTVVAKTTTWVYNNYSNPEHDESIKAFIADAYGSWSTDLEYVFLIGSDVQIPSHDYVYFGYDEEETNVCDTWYVLLDDDDIPDVAIGRLPVSSEDDVSFYVNKVIYYESHSSESWKEDIYTADSGSIEGPDSFPNSISRSIPEEYGFDVDYRANFETDEEASASLINKISSGKLMALYYVFCVKTWVTLCCQEIGNTFLPGKYLSAGGTLPIPWLGLLKL